MKRQKSILATLPLVLLLLAGCSKGDGGDGSDTGKVTFPAGNNDISFTPGSLSAKTFTFSTTAPWQAAAEQTRAAASWLEIVPSSGPAGENQQISISIRETGAIAQERSATVTISAGGEYKTFKVTQPAGTYEPLKYTISVSKIEYKGEANITRVEAFLHTSPIIVLATAQCSNGVFSLPLSDSNLDKSLLPTAGNYLNESLNVDPVNTPYVELRFHAYDGDTYVGYLRQQTDDDYENAIWYVYAGNAFTVTGTWYNYDYDMLFPAGFSRYMDDDSAMERTTTIPASGEAWVFYPGND